MKVFYSDAHLQHNPAFEIFDGGEKVPNFEVPGRAERIRAALDGCGWADICLPQEFGPEPLLAVHDAGYLEFLRVAYAEWLLADLDAPYEKAALLPATFPPAGWRRKPATLLGRAGFYMSDLSAPIVAGTWAAALASANCALSAASAIGDESKPAAFALCRPPGHHAGKANCAGYCYLNNAAVAAGWLARGGKVAVLDIDYHAGNGTQDIFYERADVLTVSIHADPANEYPYYSGYADETGAGNGAGFHLNLPLPAGTDDAHYLAAVEQALERIRAFGPGALVVSAGMDLAQGDPLGKFSITRGGIQSIGRKIAGLGLPSVITMEGGYNNAALAENLLAFLESFA